MYRALLPIIICVSSGHTAPQEPNSQITYVKLAPITDIINSTRESRIEKIPAILQDIRIDEDSTLHKSTSEGDTTRNGYVDRNQSKEYKRNEENIKRTPIDHFDDSSEDSIRQENARNSEADGDINISEGNQRSEEYKITVRGEGTTAIYESETTAVTEKDNAIDEIVDEVLDQTENYESRTKPPAPRFISKLSYFHKSDYSIPVLTNLVERPGKRRFKSKCRCEKIWNCPKLQITVPRCPNEYFLCCF